MFLHKNSYYRLALEDSNRIWALLESHLLTCTWALGRAEDSKERNEIWELFLFYHLLLAILSVALDCLSLQPNSRLIALYF